MHALVIEDDAVVAALIAEVLGEIGAGTEPVWVAIAATEEQAVAAAGEHCPDVITADLHLRAGSGRAAVRRIGQRCNGTAVVYVTGNPEELHDMPEAHIVAKPFTVDALRRAIDAALAAPRG
jgi:CheY-like chemotaxis protein